MCMPGTAAQILLQVLVHRISAIAIVMAFLWVRVMTTQVGGGGEHPAQSSSAPWATALAWNVFGSGDLGRG